MSSSNSPVRRSTIVYVTAKCTATLAREDSLIVLMLFNTENASGKLITSGRENNGGYYNCHLFYIDPNQTKTFKLPVPSDEFITGSILVQVINLKNNNELLSFFVDPKLNDGNIGFVISGSTLNGINCMGYSLIELGRVTKLDLNTYELRAQKDGTSTYTLTAMIQTSDGSDVPFEWTYNPYYIDRINYEERKDNCLIKSFIFRAKNLGESKIEFCVGHRYTACKVINYYEASKSITVKSVNDCIEPWDKSAPYSYDGKAKYFGWEKTKNKNEYVLLFTDKIDFIPPCAFANNKVIQEVTLPSECKEICPGAFCTCQELTTLNFNSKLEKIGACAFLSDIDPGVFDSPKDLGLSFFAPLECFHVDDFLVKGVKNFEFPKSLKYIGPGAFSDARCESIRIPDKVELAEDAFYECASLKSVYFEGNSPNTTASRIFFKVTTVYVPRGCRSNFEKNKAFHNVKIEEY